MKKSYCIIAIIFILILCFFCWSINIYNELVSSKEEVSTQYSNISVALERRADLIPNLVNVVKGYAKHEEDVISKVTDARKNLLSAKTVSDKSQANNELNDAINALMIVVEKYPDLQANQNFINLQDELSGTENRISTARRDYNGVVKSYNTKIKKFPNNLIASICHFSESDYFTVSDGKSEVPNVEF